MRRAAIKVLDFLTDQSFLNALAVMVGPLAFFAAPTEEIEHLLFHADDIVETTDIIFVTEEVTIAKAA